MSAIPNEVIVGLLTDAIAAAGHRLIAAALTVPTKGHKDDIELVRWFETYRLLEEPPDLTELTDEDHSEVIADALQSHRLDALLHELLAVRLTDAPEEDAERVKNSWDLTWRHLLPSIDTSRLANELFNYYDDEICRLVGRLEGSQPDVLPQIRAEGYSARIIAILHAIERHAAKLVEEHDPSADSSFVARYKRHVSQHHGQLEPPDFARRRRIAISEIFVPPSILDLHDTAEKPREVGLWQFAEEIDRTVLLGDPGGGKTTATHVLMHHYATRPIQRVPFAVTLREFAAQGPPIPSVVEHIEHTLNSFYQCPAPSGLISRLLLSGAAVVIFDGLDELVDTSRRADVTAIVEQFSLEYPLAGVLVTSRLVGYDQARLDDRQFSSFRIGRFTEDQTADYVKKWFAQEADINAPQAAKLSAAFMAESAEVPDLRENPLMLALMCILYRGEGSIPRNRPEVYEQCATLLFRKWDTRRHIYVELRARNHVESALAYLAYWLFTREETQPVVTERQLIEKATEFLHGRGFESLEDAREAAREFVEFCRGRAWVFSDAGTTASGQPLYTFTHRTFLEYFAASRLASICDTPEKLARALASHVARQEWDVVAELSVQMKDNAIDRGAERIYTTLLSERRRRSAQGRSNVLTFLGRCLKSVEIAPRVVRRLTQTSLDHLFAYDPNSRVAYDPLVAIMASCDSCRDTVRDEISLQIERMVSALDAETRLRGLSLAAFVGSGVSRAQQRAYSSIPVQMADREFWNAYAVANVERYAREIRLAAPYDVTLRFVALRERLIDPKEVIEFFGQPSTLFEEGCALVLEARYISYAAMCLYYVFDDIKRPGIDDAVPVAYEMFSALGRYILRNTQPPWIALLRDPQGTFTSAGKCQAPDIRDSTTYLGAAVTYLTLAEVSIGRREPLYPDRYQAVTKGRLGPFRHLSRYVTCRLERSGEEQASSLPDLPVPKQFRDIFRQWAAGSIDFGRYL